MGSGEVNVADLLAAYREGPEILRAAVQGMTDDQLIARPVSGRWSTLEVVCHIADMEIVYAERIRRVLAEDHPLLQDADPDRFAAALQYHKRSLSRELELVHAIRQQTGLLLEAIPGEAWHRTGNHSVAGQVTLLQLVQNITDHIPHHVKFIYEKRKALGLP